MKKIMAWVLSLALALTAAGAMAETADSVFETMSGLEWSYMSGVGAWSTDLWIYGDGSFSGEFHDTDMGDAADAYPDGTMYRCAFSGRMSLAGQADEYTWRIRVDELKMEKDQDDEIIEDGVRYVWVNSCGLSEGDEMLLYRPGTPVSMLSEDMQFWAHVLDQENAPIELETWFLSSELNESGFVGYEAEVSVMMPNPWEDLTAEELQEASGRVFGVPEGAENVIYRYLRSEDLAEMQFTWEGDEFCARIQPAELQEGELQDISGMYYEWEDTEEIFIGNCYGTIAHTRAGSGEQAQLCQWYDAEAGLMYSLSVTTTDADGLDLTVLAEQVYLPAE